MTKPPDTSCKERIGDHLQSRIADIREIANQADALNDYGLCFDYVAPETFTDQTESYFRYQISWGGPSDEFRFYINPDLTCHRVEYWFLDWFDGAGCVLSGDDKKIMLDAWDSFRGVADRRLVQ